MSKIKDWMIDMENLAFEAIEHGFTSVDDVYAYVNTYMIADRQYVEQILEKFHEGYDQAA